MKFPLTSFFFRRPIPSLGGRMVRYKPVIPIAVIGPTASFATDILVDTGADDIVFPLGLAGKIGVDLRGAPQLSARGVISAAVAPILYAPVILHLSDQVESYRWRATVAFTSAPLKFALLGIASGLEHLKATLNYSLQEVELIPQPSFPAT